MRNSFMIILNVVFVFSSTVAPDTMGLEYQTPPLPASTLYENPCKMIILYFDCCLCRSSTAGLEYLAVPAAQVINLHSQQQQQQHHNLLVL
jgi:hypothetical protein